MCRSGGQARSAWTRAPERGTARLNWRLPGNANGGMADIEVTLPARAENVAVMRHAIGGLGEALELSAHTLSDVKLAVTEACTNVVVHAYNGAEGPMQVAADVNEGRLTVVVRDEGRGIAPRPDSPGLGLGLPLIATLTDALELGKDELDRTEVRMSFALEGAPHT